MENRNGSVCGLDWIRRRSRPPKKETNVDCIRLVDLFCGCGGMTLGASEAARSRGSNLDIRLAIDNSAEAISVYRENFSVDAAVARKADITRLLRARIDSPFTEGELSLQEHTGPIDILVAGPPCQGHSDLNNHTRRHDKRNSLYFRVLRAVKLFQPKVLIVENVPTVIHDKRRVIERTISGLLELGYTVPLPMVVDVTDLGLPQKRKRHVLVAAIDGGFDQSSLLADLSGRPSTLRDYIADIQDEANTREEIFYTSSRMSIENQERVKYLFRNNLNDLPDDLRPPCHRERKHSYKAMYGRLRWDKPAQTITSGFGSMGQGRYIHPEARRTLTPHEAARIQGLPDFYDFSSVTRRTALHEMIANVVPPRLCALVTLGLMKSEAL